MRHRHHLAVAALVLLAAVAGLDPRPAGAAPIIGAPVNRFIQWPHDSLPLTPVAIGQAAAVAELYRSRAAGLPAAAPGDRRAAGTPVDGADDCRTRTRLVVTAC